MTVQCTKDGQFVLVVARDSTLPTLDLDSLRFLGGNDAPCSPVDANSAFAIFQFPVTDCGTTMAVSGQMCPRNHVASQRCFGSVVCVCVYQFTGHEKSKKPIKTGSLLSDLSQIRSTVYPVGGWRFCDL